MSRRKQRVLAGCVNSQSRYRLEALESRLLLNGVKPTFDPGSAQYLPGMGYLLAPDTFYQPGESSDGAVAAPPVGQRPFGATSDDTSEYMSGDVYVSVV